MLEVIHALFLLGKALTSLSLPTPSGEGAGGGEKLLYTKTHSQDMDEVKKERKRES